MKIEDIKELLTFTINITYQDTDIGGVVYHSNYLDYGERARAKIFRNLFGRLKVENQVWAIRNLAINYIMPATMDDKVVVRTIIKEVKGASIVFVHNFYVEEKKIAKLEADIVNLDELLKPTRIKAQVVDKLKNISNIGEV